MFAAASDAPSGAPTEPQPVVLHLMPTTGALQLARGAVGVMAEDAGVEADRVEDVRLAASEVIGFLISGAAAGGPLTVQTGRDPAPWFAVTVVPLRAVETVPVWLSDLLATVGATWSLVDDGHRLEFRCTVVA